MWHRAGGPDGPGRSGCRSVGRSGSAPFPGSPRFGFVDVDCFTHIRDLLPAALPSSSFNMAVRDDDRGVRRHGGLVSLCVGCGHQILDRFILRVFPDLEWHAACLKCSECEQHLDESRTCFIKDGKALCKEDYSRLYATKCPRCLRSFSSRDYVMRTGGGGVYHVQCFRCVRCDRQLVPGDRFTLQDGNLHCAGRTLHCWGVQTDSAPSNGVCDSRWSGGQRSERVTRVRTVLSEAQLHTLQSCYSANPRPDALLKEQLVELTGLSPRVIRVWFQNKRCKDKKKSAAARNTQHRTHEQEPCFAASPDSLDQDMLMTPLDLLSFQPSWKLLTSFSLHSDSDHDCTPHQQPDCLSERMTSCSSAGSEVMPLELNTPNSFSASPTQANQ
ncbi:insulin gene enhancer protein ISL-1-like [Salminus brasiliensis]|uniref:insulin gene enhancer protein ISL-1-like n=1 Tax=Salminus brasiliensis TaxID=930266 RepID=UPI003B8367F7